MEPRLREIPRRVEGYGERMFWNPKEVWKRNVLEPSGAVGRECSGTQVAEKSNDRSSSDETVARERKSISQTQNSLLL